MAYHPRIESSELVSFCTTRTRNSELWFINNYKLEQNILANVAKYADVHKVVLYALAIEGNHHHELARFPSSNRANFMRDVNASITRALKRQSGLYPGGSLFARRYSNEFTPESEDVEEYFFYTVLQPVKDGLVKHIKDYPGYNCFYDAISAVERKFQVVNWKSFDKQKRVDSSVRIEEFMYEVILKFQRLPGYEHLTQVQYKQLMIEKLEKRIKDLNLDRSASGKGFVGRSKLLKKQPGSLPYKTKISRLNDPRPRILCVCPKRWMSYMNWYFNIYHAFKRASERFRSGELNIEFPPGTYKPYLFVTG